jgi:hypothetical protein
MGGETGTVPSSAPRIDQRLLAAVAELDRPGRPIAETNRRVGEIANRLGLPRPSYEQVRAVVHAARNGRRVYGWRDLASDISFRTRSPRAAVDALIDRAPVTPTDR